MTEEELQHCYENYETADLLRVLNNGPINRRDDLFKLHGYAMEVCNNGDDTNAIEMFDLAEELSMEVSEQIERLEQLQEQLDKLTDLYPESILEKY